LQQTDKQTLGSAYFALTILTIAYVFSFIDRQILSLLVEPMKEDLGISDVQVSLLQGMAFALFYTFMGIPIARLADASNRRWLITAGIAVWSLMTCLCGIARSFTTLFLARVGVGVGEAALSPAAYSMLSDYFPPEKLARALAIFSTGITIGGGLAYIVGGSVLNAVQGMGEVSLPLLGELRPWQLTFVIVGLPGLLIAGLMLLVKEPPRRGQQKEIESLGATLRFVKENRRGLGSHFLGVGVLSIFGYGLMAWYPTMFARVHGMDMREIGIQFGVIYLVCGTLGALFGAWCAQKLQARGYADANMRWLVISPWFMVLPGVAAPLMGSGDAAFLVVIPLIFFQNSYFGVSLAALQLATPNRMRAQVSSILLFVTNLLGLGFGPTAVAMLTDYVYQDPTAVNWSLAITAGIACPLASVIFGYGLKAYSEMLKNPALSSQP
jgi:MFS family permease